MQELLNRDWRAFKVGLLREPSDAECPVLLISRFCNSASTARVPNQARKRILSARRVKDSGTFMARSKSKKKLRSILVIDAELWPWQVSASHSDPINRGIERDLLLSGADTLLRSMCESSGA